MENKKLKYVAVIEAPTKTELLKKFNNAVSQYGLDVIHYTITEQVNPLNQFEEIGSMEIFYSGDVVLDSEVSGEDKILSNGSAEKQPHSR